MTRKALRPDAHDHIACTEHVATYTCTHVHDYVRASCELSYCCDVMQSDVLLYACVICNDCSQMVNKDGEAVYVKLHFKTDQGILNLSAEKVSMAV
jgi:Catalase